MSELAAIKVKLWNQTVGALAWDTRNNLGEFQYDSAFVKQGFEISPLMMPLTGRTYRFPELSRSDTFSGLPGLLADSLPEKFGNTLMKQWLAKVGVASEQIIGNPIIFLKRRGSSFGAEDTFFR